MATFSEPIYKGWAKELLNAPRHIMRPKAVNLTDGFLEDDMNYRDRCMRGEPHPLNIEQECYTLIEVCKFEVREDVNLAASSKEEEAKALANALKIPGVEWAIDNSFDGPYCATYRDPSRFEVVFKIAVYLKAEHATFWKLKYGR